jgi:hypothetical protein
MRLRPAFAKVCIGCVAIMGTHVSHPARQSPTPTRMTALHKITFRVPTPTSPICPAVWTRYSAAATTAFC